MESANPYNVPRESEPSVNQYVGMRTVSIKRFDVLSAGKILGALYAFIGLIAGGIMSLFAIVGVAAGGGGGEAALGGAIMGVGALFIIPIVYGVAGFVGGMIVALIYNLVAGFAGGIQMDLEG